MARVGWLIACALGALVGCAGVLGFEDIVVLDPVAPPATEAGTGGDAAAAPGRCRATSAPNAAKRRPLATLDGGELTAELVPRLSRDERTIVFARIIALDAERFTVSTFIASRPGRDAPFEPARELYAQSTQRAYVSLTADASRVYYAAADTAFGVRRLATARLPGTEDVTISVPIEGEVQFPVFVDSTSELFFAAGPLFAPFALYRAVGSADRFEPPQRIDGIDSAVPGRETSYSEPVLSDDGLHLYFRTDSLLPDGGDSRPGAAFVATRADARSAFGDARQIEGLDPAVVKLGWISPDECRLYTYRRVDGRPESRLYVEERDP